MAAIATLFGLSPAAVEQCRVLEIGCAGGENLIPLAASFPNAQFVGLDYSQAQIKAAQEIHKDGEPIGSVSNPAVANQMSQQLTRAN